MKMRESNKPNRQKPLKNTSNTVYAEKYPVLWKRLLTLLEDCDSVKPERVTQKATLLQLGLTAEDCVELHMNLEMTTGLYGFANTCPNGIGNLSIAELLNMLTTKNNFKDVEY